MEHFDLCMGMEILERKKFKLVLNQAYRNLAKTSRRRSMMGSRLLTRAKNERLKNLKASFMNYFPGAFSQSNYRLKTILAKSSILDVWIGSECASGILNSKQTWNYFSAWIWSTMLKLAQICSRSLKWKSEEFKYKLEKGKVEIETVILVRHTWILCPMYLLVCFLSLKDNFFWN